MRTEPIWYRLKNLDGKDHLVKPGTRLDGAREAWCGLTLTADDIEPGGNHSQCKGCLRWVRDYATKATAEPPPRVVERVLVTVDRPRDGHGEAADVITKKLAALKTWKVTVQPVFQEDEKAA